MRLFTNQTANGVSDPVASLGKALTVLFSGTFGTASLSIEVSPDGGDNWIADSELSYTEAKVVNLEGGRGLTYRLRVSNADGTTSLNAWVSQRVL